jgi:hypothetical protein
MTLQAEYMDGHQIAGSSILVSSHVLSQILPYKCTPGVIPR